MSDLPPLTEPMQRSLEEIAPTGGDHPALSAESPSCPPPLQWQEVLQEVQQQATHWTVNRPGCVLTGLTLGTGPTVVFLNGLSEPRETQALLAWLLRDEFRCVLFDWRGLRSPNTRHPVTLELLVEDVLEIVDHWPGETNRLLATGFGGLVALQAMQRRPGRFDRLSLIGGYARLEFSRLERTLIRAGQFWPGRTATLPGRRLILRQNHRRWFPPFDETRYEFLCDVSGRVSVSGMAELAAVANQTDVRPLLSQIGQPVQLLSTEGQGKALRAAGDELARGLSHVVREEMHNTGLIPPLTHPHRVAKLVRPFLQGSDDVPGAGRSGSPSTSGVLSRSAETPDQDAGRADTRRGGSGS